MSEERNHNTDTINRGVELMLRRAKSKPSSRGLQVKKTFALFNKVISINFEVTWEGM